MLARGYRGMKNCLPNVTKRYSIYNFALLYADRDSNCSYYAIEGKNIYQNSHNSRGFSARELSEAVAHSLQQKMPLTRNYKASGIKNSTRK